MVKFFTMPIRLLLATVCLSGHSIQAQTLDQIDWVLDNILESGFSAGACESVDAQDGIVFCSTTSSTLPGGYILADTNQGLVCVVNIRSIPIWGNSTDITNYSEIFPKCDQLLASVQASNDPNEGLLVDLSSVVGLTFSQVDSLDRGSRENFENSGCLWIDNDYQTVGGQAVSENNWAVLSEITISKFSLISFTERMQRSTSSICEIEGGKIAIFESGKLIGVISADNPNSNLIGYLEHHEGGRARMFDGSVLTIPFADLVVTPDTIILEAVQPYTSFCSGQELVPNIYGMDIREARQRLFEAGWSPRPHDNEIEPRFLVSSPYDDGVIETLGCGGTGLNYCSYAYRHLGAELSVTSAGEVNYPVVYFDVGCPN